MAISSKYAIFAVYKVYMNKPIIYQKEWLAIHPYTAVQPSDPYFVELANRLYHAITPSQWPDRITRNICIYVAAYLEDVISGLGLWNSFTHHHSSLYGKPLPFYVTDEHYSTDDIHKEDIQFILWNTLQKADISQTYLHPSSPEIAECAGKIFTLLNNAYQEAPENEVLTDFFSGFSSEKEANRKLTWLFGHTYLTEPSMAPYIANVKPSDQFIIPTGPLALFLHEWIALLAPQNEAWRNIKGLYASTTIPESIRQKNLEMHQRFTEGTKGQHIIYLNGYNSLRQFLVETLKWEDDDNHTLPHLRSSRNFILMANPEKGILLAKDICEYIADEANPLYNKEKAVKNAFRLLTEETLCPPDLLSYCIRHQLLPDACIPYNHDFDIVQKNLDFIARHALLYYYRGD